MVGGKDAIAVLHMGIPDHLEQRHVLLGTIHRPARIEDLVPTMLRVRLRKHHQFDVARIAFEFAIGRRKIVDFIRGQRQAQLDVSLLQSGLATAQCVDLDKRARQVIFKQHGAIIDTREHRLDHAIVQQVQRQLIAAVYIVEDATLNAANLLETAVVGDIGRLAGPGGDRARPRQHVELLAFDTGGL